MRCNQTEKFCYLVFFSIQSRLWVVNGGIQGETCLSQHPTELWCDDVTVLPCVDRTIRCNQIPTFPGANMTQVSEPVIGDKTIAYSAFDVTCTERNHYFDYSVPANVPSFYFATNINWTSFFCNHDRYPSPL